MRRFAEQVVIQQHAPTRPRRPDSYLLGLLIILLVALAGAVLCSTTVHDHAGTALLVGGDALFILTLVTYLRRP